jgi:hypothetical protein
MRGRIPRIVMSRTFVDPSAYVRPNIAVTEWTEPPQMDIGAPMPETCEKESALFVAYYYGTDRVTVLRFDSVSEFYLGEPNDEALHLHPLYSRGLSSYGFYEVVGSPKASGRLRHWIGTFHDETLEVVAEAANVHTASIEGNDTHESVIQVASQYRPPQSLGTA